MLNTLRLVIEGLDSGEVASDPCVHDSEPPRNITALIQFPASVVRRLSDCIVAPSGRSST